MVNEMAEKYRAQSDTGNQMANDLRLDKLYTKVMRWQPEQAKKYLQGAENIVDYGIEKYNKLTDEKTIAEYKGFAEDLAKKQGEIDKATQEMAKFTSDIDNVNKEILRVTELKRHAELVKNEDDIKNCNEQLGQLSQNIATIESSKKDKQDALAVLEQEKADINKSIRDLDGFNFEEFTGLQDFNKLFNETFQKYIQRASSRERLKQFLQFQVDQAGSYIPVRPANHEVEDLKKYQESMFAMKLGFAKGVQRDFNASRSAEEAWKKSVELAKTNAWGRFAFMMGGLIAEEIVMGILDEHKVKYNSNAINSHSSGGSNYVPV